MVSPAAFKTRGLNAANKLRLLISSLNIPKEIPSSLSALHGKRGKKWDDGIDAITCIRNSFVHPNEQSASHNHPYYEAYNLSLWYLELVLLRLCGHKGKYSNRLAGNKYIGTVESVPWAQNDANK